MSSTSRLFRIKASMSHLYALCVANKLTLQPLYLSYAILKILVRAKLSFLLLKSDRALCIVVKRGCNKHVLV
jgi:hypothetical protein